MIFNILGGYNKGKGITEQKGFGFFVRPVVIQAVIPSWIPLVKPEDRLSPGQA